MKKNYCNKKKYFDINKILDIILITIFLVVLLSMIYSFFEPKLVAFYDKKSIVSNVEIIDDLKECADKYYDALIYEKVYIVNEMQTIFNQKSKEEISNIKDKYGTVLFYDLIIKQAFNLGNDVYSCDIEIIPLLEENKYDWNNIKKINMIIKLNKNNNTFKIFYDDLI